MALTSMLKNVWNAFRDSAQTYSQTSYGVSSSSRPDRISIPRGSERSIISAINNRFALDVSQISFEHVRLDDFGRYLEPMKSRLNECLSLSANIDQTGEMLIQDFVLTMLEEGVAALIPTDTDVNPAVSSSYEIYTLRVGSIVDWNPDSVRVRVYNERTGKKEEIVLPKKEVVIVENPFYTVMNAPNSMVQRLKRKLYLLDTVDEQAGSGKLDLIIQYPYAAKSPLKQNYAEQRRRDIEDQIANSKLGIAYVDGTEHITQLNRSLENNLLKQVEYLTQMVFNQLGISQEILSGTADEDAMNNYYYRITEPMVARIANEMSRKWISQTARTQGQKVLYFRDPFKLIPVSKIAEIADKFTRNEIMTSNEIRQIVGLRPVKDPKADELRNSNISESSDAEHIDINGNVIDEGQGGNDKNEEERL